MLYSYGPAPMDKLSELLTSATSLFSGKAAKPVLSVFRPIEVSRTRLIAIGPSRSSLVAVYCETGNFYIIAVAEWPKLPNLVFNDFVKFMERKGLA